jgi:hypothetical protein
MVDENLLATLAFPFVQYVNVTGNPLASVDREDLWEKLDSKQQLSKLIWIPWGWLPAGNWKSNYDQHKYYLLFILKVVILQLKTKFSV